MLAVVVFRADRTFPRAHLAGRWTLSLAPLRGLSNGKVGKINLCLSSSSISSFASRQFGMGTHSIHSSHSTLTTFPSPLAVVPRSVLRSSAPFHPEPYFRTDWPSNVPRRHACPVGCQEGRRQTFERVACCLPRRSHALPAPWSSSSHLIVFAVFDNLSRLEKGGSEGGEKM